MLLNLSRRAIFRSLATLAAATLGATTPAGPGLAHGSGHGETAFGQAGDPRRPARPVLITMRESDGHMAFVPERIEVRRGEQIRFMLRNAGSIDHEFILATRADNLKHLEEMRKNPDMEHDEPNMIRIRPGQTGEILWQFTKAGEFDVSCLIPGHRESGMHGIVVVK